MTAEAHGRGESARMDSPRNLRDRRALALWLLVALPEGPMGGNFLAIIGMAAGLTTLAAASFPLVAQNTQLQQSTQEEPQTASPSPGGPALARGDATGVAPSVTVLDTQEVQG